MHSASTVPHVTPTLILPRLCAGKHISVGTASATVQIWDASRGKQIRALKGHAARVSALAWNKNTLSSGGRDSVIINHDVRCAALLYCWRLLRSACIEPLACGVVHDDVREVRDNCAQRPG